MKRKSIAIVGLASPLLLVAFCAFSILILGTLSWLIFGSADASSITKIATVGPFFTAKILPGQDETSVDINDEGSPTIQTIAENSGGDTSSGGEGVGAEPAIVREPTPDIPHEEIEEQLGFAIPENTVNSITYDGTGSKLFIPKMNLEADIQLAPIENQTWKVDHLDQTVGHLEGTAPIGSNSNLVLAAHVTLEGGVYGPFAGLGKLEAGDIVTVFDGGQKFDYMIDRRQNVERTAVDVTFPSDSAEITLITCNNWDEATGQYAKRLVMKGHLITN